MDDDRRISASVEKEITEDLLGSGLITFGPAERDRLELPEHSGEVELLIDGEAITASWRARTRHLTGETLTDRLQEYAQVGWLLRFERTDGAITCAVVSRRPAGSTAPLRWTPAPPRPGTAAKPTKRKRRRPTGVRYRLEGRDEFDWNGSVGLHRARLGELRDQVEQGGWDPLEMLDLRMTAERLSALDAFEELMAVDVANVDRMDHQEAAARKVLTAMSGRGVLADEVGLGKTIEAGLIIKELRMRGMVNRVLIICPATLREQWRAEMEDKFDEDFQVVTSGYDPAIRSADRLIMSLNLAIRNGEVLTKRPWDLVLVDEAHRLTGKGALKTRRSIGDLTSQARYVLFLTATPVQNDLTELYRLVELLRPGTFPSQAAFKRRFVDPDDLRRPVKADELRSLVSSVMVRTTRAQAGLDNVSRHATDHAVRLSKPERELYHLCTDALRTVMTDPADTNRRRHLAHRLTASPYSLATSALRMAEHHPDPRACEALREIGHLANEIRGTAREQVALDLINRWTDEHGRVLLFSQHTDTVQGLLRLLTEQGVPARAFHGGMATKARAKAIDAFRSGEARVLLSTDSGAEGQNLQFANCVVNYDLPWNPMRIEQRIGRVHRVTQVRDVHVANLFAVGTVDEDVYRLLHDKLRMFELLFGQVTTILGEMAPADGDTATFEGRVLNALLAPDDAAMRARLDALGDQLAEATERANEQIGSDEGLSAWLADSQPRAHLADLPTDGATELRPETVERTRRRQAELTAFVERYLKVMGAEIIHRVDDSFLSARLPEELAAEVGGATTLHLAFDRAGLEAHPEAELCAVGSEVFDEIVESLRLRGDLHATLAAPPAISPRPQIAHTDDTELVARVIGEPTTWSARTTWRATTGDGTREEIVEIEVGTPPAGDGARTELDGGQSLPESLGDADEVLAAVVEAVHDSGELDDVADRASDERTERLLAEQEARVEHIDSRLEALERRLEGMWSFENRAPLEDEVRSLTRAREAFARAAAGDDVEVRAYPLTFVVEGGDDFVVEETWRHRAGAEVVLTYEWLPGDPVPDYPSDAGGEIETLGMCDDGHVVDASQRFDCEICGRTLCDACAPDKVLTACSLCDRRVCNRCLGDALCPTCYSPERLAKDDTEHEKAWGVGGGRRLLVSERAATLIEPDGTSTFLVPTEDVDDADRVRVRAFAAQLGLLPDSGARLTGTLEDIRWDADTVLSVSEVLDASHEVEPNGRATVDGRAAALLPPDAPAVPVTAEDDRGAGGLLDDLREHVQPPRALCIAITPTRETTVVELVAGGLRQTTWRQRPLRPLKEIATVEVPLEPSDPTEEVSADFVAHCELGGVRLEASAVHTSYLLTASTTSGSVRTFFVPGFEGATLEGETFAAGTLAERGLAPRTPVVVEEPVWTIDEELWPTPSRATLAGRTIESSWALAEGSSGGRPALAADLDLLGDGGRRRSAAAPRDISTVGFPLAAQLLDALDDLAGARPPTRRIVLDHRMVAERWTSDHGTAERRYEIREGELPWPVLDDTGEPAPDFGVDSEGHLHSPSGAWECTACSSSRCRACGPAGSLAPCRDCGQPTCGFCRTAAPHSIVAAECDRCGNRSCSGCGRQPLLTACAICAREVCQTCFVGDWCATCASLAPATSEQRSRLPRALGAAPLAVLVADDERATVALLCGQHRGEVAVIRQGEITHWVSVVNDRHSLVRLRLAVTIADPHLPEVEVRLAPVLHPPDLGRPSMHLPSEVRHEVQSTIGAPGYGLAPWRSAPVETTDVDPIAALDPLLGAVRVPDQIAPPEHRALTTLLASHRPSAAPTGALTVRIVEDLDAWFVTSAGLVHRRNGAPPAVELTPWRPIRELPAWAADGWSPVPKRAVVAEVNDIDAVVTGIGMHRALGIRTGGVVRWWAITEAGDDLLRAAVGERLGRDGVLVDIDAVSRDYQEPTILGATLESRNISPLITEEDGPGSVTELRDVAEYWAIEPRTPMFVPLASDLADAFIQDDPLAGDDPRTTVGIGRHVLETWNTAAGPRQVRYDVQPRQPSVELVAADTGQPTDTLEFDRQGHLVAELATCTYCGGRTCRNCIEPVVSCVLCEIPLCTRCVAPIRPNAPTCPACASLHRLKRREIRRLGRDLPKGIEAWAGRDDVHTILCLRPRDGAWSIEVRTEGAHAVALQLPVTDARHDVLDAFTGDVR